MRTRQWGGSLAAALSLAGAACTSVRPVQPEQFIPQHNPGLVSVWTAGGDAPTLVENPAIHGDTLAGLVFERPWAMPLKDIVKVEADARDPGKTALFVAGLAASAVGLVVMISGPTTVRGQPYCTDVNDKMC